ncbi:SDR family oxidoreductase [Novosphingobium rosa]|uniref:SDR family oxidoreductase n=1 Tax=Novosphingobium rosa TaxID=76978 RepID=UPI00082B2FE6|nr:SDR family oxidoreductase [Novosphingobium rosa]
MKGIAGETVIVTGGAASIGKVLTERFHAEGANVVIAARTHAAAQELAERLGQRALAVETDIRDDAALERLVNRTLERFGGLDVIVNNACSYVDEGAASTRVQWLETLDTNVVSGALLVEMARPHLAKGPGSVVNIASISGLVAQAGRWTYPVSKAAILHLTRQQALDYAPQGIRVNALVAGWTWSDPIAGLSGDDRAKADAVAGEFHLLGRLGRAEEVADGALFLCSDHASFTTGSELRVEGGYLAMGPEQAGPAIAKLTGGSSSVLPR